MASLCVVIFIRRGFVSGLVFSRAVVVAIPRVMFIKNEIHSGGLVLFVSISVGFWGESIVFLPWSVVVDFLSGALAVMTCQKTYLLGECSDCSE